MSAVGEFGVSQTSKKATEVNRKTLNQAIKNFSAENEAPASGSSLSTESSTPQSENSSITVSQQNEENLTAKGM